MTVDETLKILAGDSPGSVSAADQALVRGYRDAMTFVQRRADDGFLTWNRELLVGVQDRVVAGDRSAGAGRLRTGSAWVSNASTGSVVFEPSPPEQVPDLVDQLCEVVETADWHPAVTAAWVHVAIAAVHPFKDGNGRTARVLASLAMYRGGFRHPAFTSLEEWWGRHPGAYYGAFDCLGSRFDQAADVTDFVSTHVGVQLSQVFELGLRQQTEGMLWMMLENLLEDRGLPARLANALYDSFFGRDITTAYYGHLIDASIATARNDLVVATAAELLAVEGRTNGRRYVPGRGLVPAVAVALGVETSREAVFEELLRRANAAIDWPKSSEPPSLQGTLPGVG